MCTDILIGKMIDGHSMLHGSSRVTSEKPVYEEQQQVLYVLVALHFSDT